MHGFMPPAATGYSINRRSRALFLSDLHLGTPSSQTSALLEFLRSHEAETIYLVGDIVDFWRLRREVRWPVSHDEVVQTLLEKVREGSRVVFIPGNHDEVLRSYCGMNFGGIEIARDCVHTTALGHRLLVLHGDEFDVAVRYAKWLRFLGDRAYEFVLWCDRPLNWTRRRLGLGFWSLSVYAKTRVKAAAAYIEEFETALAGEALRRKLDGVVCGHVHHPADRKIGGVRYLNCGDWVENCTAIAEDANGELSIVRWIHAVRLRPAPVAQKPILEAA
ncbi:MAG: UDP-2,3-diacylglucosamine diphosphatase [Rhodomicrobium sp.]